MEKNIQFILLIFAFSFSACTRSVEQLVAEADQAYAADQKEKARELYVKAADMGDAQAHFSLAYKFAVSHEESVLHFTAAARKGHKEGLEQALDYLFFRAISLTDAQPQQALDLYHETKRNYPSLTIFNEETVVATLRKAVEPGPLDVQAFIARYDLKKEEYSDFYSTWKLAEEASRGGRFGKPDPALVLQLISRGGGVPFELEVAVDSAYTNWKENRIFEFNICDFITSGMGLSYCSAIEEEEANKEFDDRIKGLSPRLKNNAGAFLRKAFKVASAFIDEKASQEEMHGGSGYAMWMRRSVIRQKQEYLDVVEQINTGISYDSVKSIADSTSLMNETYRSVYDILKKKPLSDFNAQATAEGLWSVQEQWLEHKEVSALLFTRIDPMVSKQQWLNWLTAKRIADLRRLLEISEYFRE